MDLFYRFDFAAARSLPQLPSAHPCSRLHGHTFQVELRLRGTVGQGSGWVLDFDELERAVRVVRERLDHRCLNDIPGLAMPTTEHLAVWLWDQLCGVLPQLWRITVQEHPARGVHYYGPASR
jgi:6-pyruvoyltetrahydropterin/6-carboxytetrahydropterin synthase